MPGVLAAAVAIKLKAPVLIVVVVAARRHRGRPSRHRDRLRAPMTRYRDLGLTVGQLPPGPLNAITDVDGVAVGMTTLIEGEGPLVVGRGPVRTGVTVIVPHPGIGAEPVFAGCHRLNGNGELTGLEWVRESGQLTTPVAITNTHSVGVVRDALVAAELRGSRPMPPRTGACRSSGETYDGALNDINGMHVRPEHLFAALDSAATGPVAEGGVGGGTGMICHEFKGGTGTASRVAVGGWTVGALVQANYGRRERLTVDGVPVGREIPVDAMPSPWDEEERRRRRRAGRGLDHRDPRDRRADAPPSAASGSPSAPVWASLGSAGAGEHSSGDIFLAFSTGEPRRARGATRPTATSDAGRRHDDPRRRDQRAVLGRDRGHRGSDPQRPRRAPRRWSVATASPPPPRPRRAGRRS